jgi:serine/threonine-protein kinase HipA
MATAPALLAVRFADRIVGRIRAVDGGRIGFTYDESWLAAESAFPISLSLPLAPDEFAGGAGHAFFANLLPEGAARQAICARLGISMENDLALLRAIGGECAGALSVVDPDDAPPDPEAYRYEKLRSERLQSLVESDDDPPLLLGGPGERMSLAGAQDKLPVAVMDGEIHLPQNSAPSTHIIKLPIRRYAHAPVNEAFVTGLAERVGLDVVKGDLLQLTSPPSFIVERYDRRRSSEHWPVVRLHQEDLCQALGLSPATKYEQEGGPTLVAVIEVVRDHSHEPLVDVRRMIEWQAFNVVAGNSDGHGKNLSIVYDGGRIRLAPFYDLLATRHYPGLERALAMSVGGRRDSNALQRAQWEALAAALGIGSRLVVDVVRGVAERCAQSMDAWTDEFRNRHGEQSILQTLPRAIAARARVVARRMTRG